MEPGHVRFSAVAMVLVVMDKLRPGRAFWIPLVLYASYTVFGVALGVAVSMTEHSADATVAFSRRVTDLFPWCPLVNMVLMGLLLAAGVDGYWTALRRGAPRER